MIPCVSLSDYRVISSIFRQLILAVQCPKSTKMALRQKSSIVKVLKLEIYQNDVIFRKINLQRQPTLEMWKNVTETKLISLFQNKLLARRMLEIRNQSDRLTF